MLETWSVHGGCDASQKSTWCEETAENGGDEERSHQTKKSDQNDQRTGVVMVNGGVVMVNGGEVDSYDVKWTWDAQRR